MLQVPFRPAQLPEGYENFTRPTITIELLQLEDVDLIRRAIVKLKARKQIEIREDVEEVSTYLEYGLVLQTFFEICTVIERKSFCFGEHFTFEPFI